MRRWLLVCACALVALVAVGCGSDSSSDGGKSASSNEPITLTLWWVANAKPEVMDEIVKTYHDRHPNVTVKVVAQPAAAYFAPLIRSAIAKHSGPDILGMYASPFTFDYADGIRSLKDLITPEDRAQLTGWEQGTSPDGEPLVVPQDAAGQIFYYNKHLFKKAGLDPEAPPTTWDELLTTCDKLKAAGIVPINAAFKDGGYLEVLLMAFQAQYMTAQEQAEMVSNPHFDAPSAVKVIDLMKDLKARGCFTPNAEAIPLFPDGANNFKAGKAAMHVGFLSGDMHWAQYRETKWGKDGLGTFLPPLVPDSNFDEPQISYGASGGNAITKWSKHPKEAYDFLMYLGSPEVQKKNFDEVGILPANRSVQLTTKDPVAQQLLDWIRTKDASLTLFNLLRANVETVMLKFVPQIMTGEVDYLKDVVPELQTEQDRAVGK